MKFTICSALFFFFSFWLGQLFASNIDHRNEGKEFKVASFSKVEIEGAYKIYLSQGKKCSLSVDGDEDLIDDLNVDVERGTLYIDMDDDKVKINRSNSLTLYITVRDLSKLVIEGGVKLYTKGYLELDDFQLKVSGGGRLNMELAAKHVDIKGEGGIWITLEGRAESLDSHFEGAGKLYAKDFETKNVRVKMEGAGWASVYAEESLTAKLEGIGRIKYYGNPKHVNKSVEGLGAISKQ
jgi:hypothetical protein